MGKLNEIVVTMPPNEERDLIWFFGIGQSVFEKSTCGSMLDALERDSCTSKKCAKCKGQGVIGGDDYTNPEYGAWCDRCKGIGTLPVASRRSKNALTARPKPSSRSSSGKTPADKTLTRYAAVSRRINRLQETCPESVQILAAYYGNAGTRWAQTEGYTRIFPVIVLTEPGATLIKKAQANPILTGDQNRDAHEQLGQIHMANQIKPDGGRTKLFREGETDAEKLLEQATVDWLGTVKK